MKKNLISSRRQRRPSRSPEEYPIHADIHSQDDLFFHASAFHKAAESLAASFQPDANDFGHFDAFPIVFIYRHALELHLKTIVLGEGGKFLPTEPDPISVSNSHSVSWLAQFVSQIVIALKWENEFKCEGVKNLVDFRKTVATVNSVDPGSYNFRLPFDPHKRSSIREFAAKMDALLDLLSTTADGLAAEWDLRSGGEPTKPDSEGGGFGPTIQ
jgi:hypothetical protein